MRPVFRVARKRVDRVPRDADKARFEIPDLEDLTIELSSRAA